MDSGRLGFKSCLLFHFLAVCPWGGHFTSLPPFPNENTSRSCYEDEIIHVSIEMSALSHIIIPPDKQDALPLPMGKKRPADFSPSFDTAVG